MCTSACFPENVDMVQEKKMAWNIIGTSICKLKKHTQNTSPFAIF